MVLFGMNLMELESVLPAYIRGRRWFGGKARPLRSVQIVETAPMNEGPSTTMIALAQINYADGGTQKYVLPLGIAAGDDAVRVAGATITTLPGDGEPLTVYDATFDPRFTLGLLDAIRDEKTVRNGTGEIAAWHMPTFPALDTGDGDLSPSVMGAEQSNTSVRYGDRYILKMFRRLEEGMSPELEFGRYLSEKRFANTPPLLGAIEYKSGGAEPLTLAILQRFVRNQGDAWSYTLRSLESFFERAMALTANWSVPQPDESGVPSKVMALTQDYLASARVLAERTAQLHLALGEGAGDDAFEPEPFTPAYEASLFVSMNATATEAFALLRGKLDTLPDGTRQQAEALLQKQDEVDRRFEPFRDRPISAIRTRVHGDFHLGQVLYTGADFLIIDFEGEPVRSLAERRKKHSPLKDVAGMLRSFHYAAYSSYFHYLAEHDQLEPNDIARLDNLAQSWSALVGAEYLNTYLSTAGNSQIVPKDKGDLDIVLDAHLLEKAVYELIYELNNRPDWVRIPLSGIAQLIR
jgi:trehalose synthase-fused probable maltokinase